MNRRYLRVSFPTHYKKKSLDGARTREIDLTRFKVYRWTIGDPGTRVTGFA